MNTKELKEKFDALMKEAAGADEEAKGETDEKSEDKDVEDIKKSLTESIRETIRKELADASKEASKESKEKAAKISEGIEVKDAMNVNLVSDREEDLYTKKNGEKISMTLSTAKELKNWFISSVRKDLKGAEASFKKVEIMTKGGLEPLNETVAADGGVLVPTILADFIVAIREDNEVMRPNSYNMNVEGMKSNTFDIPKELTNPKVAWADVEQYDSDKSTTSIQFEKQTLTPYTVAAIVAITNQLVEDSPFRMPQIIAQQLGRAMAAESDKVAIVGTGVGQPTGLNTYTPSATIAAGGNLAFTHMTSAVYGMRQNYRQNAVWVMNSSRLALVQNLRDTNNMPIFQPQLLSGNVPTLMGKPVLENNNVGNDRIYLVNLKDYYYYAIKHGVRISTSDQAYVSDISTWERNMIAIRAEERYDAELIDTRALVMIQNP